MCNGERGAGWMLLLLFLWLCLLGYVIGDSRTW